MSKPVTVSEAQDQLPEIGFDLYRIMQRLHHQHEGMKAQYETVREFYDAEEAPPATRPEDPPRETSQAEARVPSDDQSPADSALSPLSYPGVSVMATIASL